MEKNDFCFIVFESFDSGVGCSSQPILVTISERYAKDICSLVPNRSYKKFDLYD